MAQDGKNGKIAATAYKELGIVQLRTLLEVSRQGSQAAAARALDLAQPTVWEQLRALERHLGVKLLIPQGRGCALTPDGELLIQLAQPLLAGFAALTRQFHEARGVRGRELSVAATPRGLCEDLTRCVSRFEDEHPEVMLRLFEHADEEILPRVADETFDLGFTPAAPTGDHLRTVDVETIYDVGWYVICPRSHPLAKRRKFAPEDLLSYPIVNGPGTLHGQRLRSLESQIEADRTLTRRIVGYHVASIRRFVKLGFGIGIVPRHDEYPDDSDLHERSLSETVGRLTIQAAWIKGNPHPFIPQFLETARAVLK
jgi:DNA-binding transcriptional LysR family regulator